MIYTAVTGLYEEITRAALYRVNPGSPAVQPAAHKPVTAFLRKLRELSERYESLDATQRSLAREAFYDPDLDGALEARAVVNGDYFPEMMDGLVALGSRVGTKPSRPAGRPPHGDQAELAKQVCLIWEGCTGRRATWNDKGYGGLRDFHAVCSDDYDFEWTLGFVESDQRTLAPIKARFSDHRRAAGSALRKAARRLRAK